MVLKGEAAAAGVASVNADTASMETRYQTIEAANRLLSDLRPTISPPLLAEIQAFLLPLAAILAAFGAKFLYFDLFLQTSEPMTFYVGIGLLGAVIVSLAANQFDLHSPSAIVATKVQIRLMLATASVAFLLIVCLLYLLKISDSVSRGWFALWYVMTVGLMLVERLGILYWVHILKSENRLMQRLAVYGTPPLLDRIVDVLLPHDRNLVLAGAFSDEANPASARVQLRGGLRELVAFAQEGACDRIVVALPAAESAKIRDAIARLEMLPLEVQLAPDAITIPHRICSSKNTGGLVLLDIQKPPLSSRGIIVKTIIDYVLGSIALVLLSPAMLLIAIAIKLDSKGPVFFIQSRHGHNHRIIRVIKFRTMNVAEDGPVVTQAVRGDKRITGVGRFLRRTSLDELPQIFNVLRGELSLVGPRPHAVTHNEAYSRRLSNYANRHKVKPGITGWAQVNGFRGETKTPEDMQQRVEFDLYYINNWSPWFDVQIIVRTALVPFYSSNAY